MRLTYQQIKEQHLRNINLVGSTDQTILADFNANLGQRYQLALARLSNFKTTVDASFQVGMSVTPASTTSYLSISSITSSGTTATVVTTTDHGYSTSDSVIISGVTPAGYNGTFTITVTDTTTFTYTLPASVSDVAGTNSQYYPFPQGEVQVEGMYITIGSVNYPLQPINSRWNWEQLNAIQIQASAIPQFYFARSYDFGVWPTPQASYSGTISYRYRDRNLSVDDYSTGTVTVTQGSQVLVGSGTTFTAAMVGRWFVVTDTTVPGQGYWFLITGYIDSTHLQLFQPWSQATASGATYLIGETPDVPEEVHTIFANGTAADYYGGMQKDTDNQAYYDNLFWTGSSANTDREEGSDRVAGGLLGAVNRYSDRDNRRLVKRKPKLSPLQYKVWATSLS